MQASYTAPSSSSSSTANPATATPLQHSWRGRLWPWSGCVLSAPALSPNPRDATPLLLSAASWLSQTLPKLQVTGLDIQGLSRNAAVVNQYQHDPLNWHGRMRARWAHEMLLAMESLRMQLERGEVNWPVLVIQGTADSLVHAAGATFLHAQATHADKKLRQFEGGFHELLNDHVTQAEATREITEWIQERSKRADSSSSSSSSSSTRK